jgi:hypothetical protein
VNPYDSCEYFLGPDEAVGNTHPRGPAQVWELRHPTGGAGARRGWCDGCSRRHTGVDMVAVGAGRGGRRPRGMSGGNPVQLH